MVSISLSDAQLLVQSAGVLSTKQELESRLVESNIHGVLSERNPGSSSRKELHICTGTCKMYKSEASQVNCRYNSITITFIKDTYNCRYIYSSRLTMGLFIGHPPMVRGMPPCDKGFHTHLRRLLRGA